MKRFTAVPTTAVAIALVLAGCKSAGSGSFESSMPGMDQSTTTPSPSVHASAAEAACNNADIQFAQTMIPHHRQAVQMTEIILAEQEIDPHVKQLAERIKAAQGPEIDKLSGWLKAWGEASSTSAGLTVDGMMNAADLADLEGAQGGEAAHMFLAQMMVHHQGAITMAEEEVANGANPGAVGLAQSIVEDRKAEIQAMIDLFASP